MPDAATAELMGELYAEASRRAQLAALRAQRATGAVDARSWGGFIVTGTAGR